tara:strand:+ start:77 stop:460 length:384 start_codon:yes stop_codon:yes gene_type:complete
MYWEEKFKKKHTEKITVIQKKFGQILPGEKMLISTPDKIYNFISNIAKGKFITVTEMRKILAQNANADGTCHLTTGIFLKIAIEYSLESNLMLPFWRVIDYKSNLAKKLSCGIEFIKNNQIKENINI